MSEFINTIGVLGDEATMDAVIERTITEFKDDTLTEIGDCAFCACKSLKKVIFPRLTRFGKSAFKECVALSVADFWVVNYVGNQTAFKGCTVLKALILRSSEVASNPASNTFEASSIQSGTGYIYVPRALIEEYKVATNWSVYADQFRALEDYTVDGTTTGELDESKI